MDNIQQQIDAIEAEMRKTPYHKGTEGWFGKMRARIAKLKAQVIDRQIRKSSGGGGGFAIRKFGDATVVLVGFPSVGKSTLLNNLTNANSPTAAYAFTTVSVIPGMMDYLGAQIQILDVPGLIEGASRGAGRGREVLSVVRGADLLLIIAEAGKEKDFQKITDELYQNGVRINEIPPKVVVKKALRGGIKINSTTQQPLDRETIKEIAKEFGIGNAEIFLKEPLNMERMVDGFATNRVYVPALFIASKVDKLKDYRKSKEYPAVIPISAEAKLGLEELKRAVWDALGLVRVYLREPGKRYNPEEPWIARISDSLSDILARLGPDLADRKLAKVWGPGAKFPGQTVSLGTKVQDGMEVTFI